MFSVHFCVVHCADVGFLISFVKVFDFVVQLRSTRTEHMASSCSYYNDIKNTFPFIPEVVLECEDDLADILVGSHSVVCFLCPLNRNAAVDETVQFARGEQRKNPPLHLLHERETVKDEDINNRNSNCNQGQVFTMQVYQLLDVS